MPTSGPSAQLRDALVGHRPSRLAGCPRGTGFTIAFRRAIRSAAGDGIPIEDLGIPGIPYEMTSDDLLKSNKDLLAFCTACLAVVTSEEMIMVEFDPGPPPQVADHLAKVPSYAATRTSSGTTGARSSTAADLIDRRSCSALPPTPGPPSGSPADVGRRRRPACPGFPQQVRPDP